MGMSPLYARNTDTYSGCSSVMPPKTEREGMERGGGSRSVWTSLVLYIFTGGLSAFVLVRLARGYKVI